MKTKISAASPRPALQLPDRDPAHQVLRDVVQEDEEQGEAAEEVKPQVALERREGKGYLDRRQRCG